MNTTLIMNASEGRIQFVLEQEGSLACAQEWSAPSKGTELLTPALADAFQRLGFLPNLSIVDLLFNMGPESLLVLQKSF